MPTPRAYAAVAVLHGKIYVMGGQGASGAPLGVVERYDPATNQWETVSSLRERRFSAAAATYGGSILLIGGRDEDGKTTDAVEQYDVGDDDWDSFDDLGDEREGLAAFVVGGYVYAFGGSDENGNLRKDCEYYAGDDWYPYVTWTLGVPRAAFAAAPIDDGVLVFGGYSIFGPEPDVEFYVPNEGGDERAPLPEPRGGLAGVAGNGRVYAIGGENAAGQAVARVDVYDPVADAWQAGTPLPAGRKGAVAAEVNGTLYVFGGRTDGGALATTSLSMALGTATGPAVPAAAFDLVLDGPNPLRDRARLTLALDRPMTAQVAVYDALGRRVALLHDGPLGAGQHALVWEAAGLPAGAYLVRATAGGERVVQRLTVVR